MLNSDDIWYWPLFQKAGEEELYTMVFVGEQTYGGGEEGLRIGGPTLVAAGAVLDMGDKRINNGANGVKLFIIDDGAQVIYNNNHPFYGTMRKNIVGYGEGTGNWYLLSCPIPHDNVYAENSKIHNLVDNGDYDLYSFDQSENDEWRNFKIDGDNPRWNRGQGVLYASKNGTTVEIEGYLNQSFSGYNVQYDESASFKGFNLVGNPWTYDAYINRTYYRMNAEGTGLVEVTTNEPIHPLEAVFVIATPEDSKVIFTRVPGEFVSQTMTATPQLPLSHDQSEHQDASLVFSLLAGWNWFAPAVETSLETLQTMFGSDAVIGNTSGTIVPGQMVKIYVSEGGEFSITGYASSTNITIEQGTNWIGYLGANNVGIATLFGDDFVPENGDKIISQDGGFAIYTVTEEGSGWSGTLSELQPGKGYIYISNSVDSKTVTIE